MWFVFLKMAFNPGISWKRCSFSDSFMQERACSLLDGILIVSGPRFVEEVFEVGVILEINILASATTERTVHQIWK